MTSPNPAELNLQHVRSNFDRAAAQFVSIDFILRYIANELLQRMQPMTLQPLVIADVGSAYGAGSKRLAWQFPKARVISIDLSPEMLRTAKKKGRWFTKVRELQADATQLPLATGSVDLVVANMLLPWINDPPAFFAEVARVLRVDGLFMFSTLGPDSLAEIRAAWSEVDDDLHVHLFPDMHNVGDAVIRANLSDPVLDVDYQRVTFEDAETLLAERAATGARNCLRNRRRTLTGKDRMNRFWEQLWAQGDKGIIEFKLELVYGHAFGKGPRRPPGDFLLAPEDIGRRRV